MKEIPQKVLNSAGAEMSASPGVESFLYVDLDLRETKVPRSCAKSSILIAVSYGASDGQQMDCGWPLGVSSEAKTKRAQKCKQTKQTVSLNSKE